MKKQLLLIALLFAALNLSAQQVENADFENWEPDENSGGEKPINWIAGTSCDNPEEVCFGFIMKDEKDNGYGAHIWGRGELTYNALFSAKPTQLSFWYKGNEGKVNIKILSIETAEAVSENDIVGQGSFTLSDAESYTKIEVPIVYKNQSESKSIQIEFIGQTNSDFSIDDIELIYSVDALTDKEITEIAGSNVVTSSLVLKKSVDELSVYNTSGMLVLTDINTQRADFSNLSEGLYMVTLKKGNAMGTLKVIKN